MCAVEYAKHGVGSDAYRVAFPKSQKWKNQAVITAASELLKRPYMKRRLAELKAKVEVKNENLIERILLERKRLAFFDIRKFYNADGTLKPIHELDDDTAAALTSFEVDEFGNEEVVGRTKKIKMADKDKALSALERIHGMYKTEEKSQTVLNIQINL